MVTRSISSSGSVARSTSPVVGSLRGTSSTSTSTCWGRAAPDRHRRRRSRTALLGDGDAGLSGQERRHVGDERLLDLIAADHRDAGTARRGSGRHLDRRQHERLGVERQGDSLHSAVGQGHPPPGRAIADRGDLDLPFAGRQALEPEPSARVGLHHETVRRDAHPRVGHRVPARRVHHLAGQLGRELGGERRRRDQRERQQGDPVSERAVRPHRYHSAGTPSGLRPDRSARPPVANRSLRPDRDAAPRPPASRTPGTTSPRSARPAARRRSPLGRGRTG